MISQSLSLLLYQWHSPDRGVVRVGGIKSGQGQESMGERSCVRDRITFLTWYVL